MQLNESPHRKQRGISMKFNKRCKPRSIRLKNNKNMLAITWLHRPLLITGLLFSVFSACADEDIDKNQVERFGLAIAQIKRAYINPVSDEKIFSDAINGILTGLDPHSDYLDEEEMKLLQDKTQGELQGLGVEITLNKNNLISVVSVIDDSPAQKAGIQNGDTILAINDNLLPPGSITTALKKLRGKAGTSVQLTIIRPNENVPHTVKLTRSAIPLHSVKSKLIDNNFGYIRISQFQINTAADVTQAIRALRMKAHGSLKGLILDLRNNPGGLLTQATEVADLFLDTRVLGTNKLIVYTRGRLPSSQTEIYAKPGDLLYEAPLVILINEGTASSAEILAGALQDHKRALLIGTRSFGKGSVQSVIPLDKKTGIKLTTALYYTPYGRVIQAEGIIPDVEIKQAKVKKNLPKSSSLSEIHEDQLEGHLQQHFATANKLTITNHPSEFEKTEYEDHQLYEALLILKSIYLSK